jgi:hypothetical protein
VFSFDPFQSSVRRGFDTLMRLPKDLDTKNEHGMLPAEKLIIVSLCANGEASGTRILVHNTRVL